MGQPRTGESPLLLACLGASGAGKTTLAAALTAQQARQRLARPLAVADLLTSPEERARGATLGLNAALYRTPRRAVTHLDLPGQERYLRSVLAGLAIADAALVVVDAAQGLSSWGRQAIELARAWGVAGAVGAITGVDRAEPELAELAALELAEALEAAGWSAPVVAPARARQVLAGGEGGLAPLVEAIDALPSRPVQPGDTPRFLVARVHAIPGRGTVAWGRLLAGSLGPGERLEVIGAAAPRATRVGVIERFDEVLPGLEAGSWGELLLRDTPPDAVARGSLLCAPGAAAARARWEAAAPGLLAWNPRTTPRVHLHAADTNASVRALAGERIEVEAAQAQWAEPGTPFLVRVEGRTCGLGRVLE